MSIKFGRKFKETIKFVLGTTMVVLPVAFFASTMGLIPAIWSWCRESDTGAMWFINIGVAVLITELVCYFILQKKVGLLALLLKLGGELILSVVMECLIWHREETGEMFTKNFNWANAGVFGVVMIAAVIMFLNHLRSVDYGET